MGSVSLMLSLQRFVDAHGDLLAAEALEALPPSIRAHGPTVEVVSTGIRIESGARWVLDDGAIEEIDLPGMDAYEVAAIDDERFGGDCDMRW